jgi:hypothetical protein
LAAFFFILVDRRPFRANRRSQGNRLTNEKFELDLNAIFFENGGTVA